MEILHKDSEYESLEIERIYNTWYITAFDGDVSIECEDSNFGNQTLVLNQDDIKILISFLQKQILNQNK
jgi:hypothetical protein